LKFKESSLFRRRGPVTGRKPEPDRQADIRRRGNIPAHIAVIMDGNGRWAQNRGLPRIAGHNEGVESVRETVEACGQLGVQYLTLYAFSIENWKRPDEEVTLLMRLLMRALRDETDKLHRNNVRVSTIGETSSLPREVRGELEDAIARTAHNTGLNLCLALSYSGRWDITRAARSIAAAARSGAFDPASITEETVAAHLSTSGMPDPDLLIRTSGERRISNFLLWQTAYSEIYISDLFWPEFRRDELYNAIEDYQRRERRFGMVSEQIRADHRPTTAERIEVKNVPGL
jgi:undecaprenyl diphosphate synthase